VSSTKEFDTTSCIIGSGPAFSILLEPFDMLSVFKATMMEFVSEVIPGAHPESSGERELVGADSSRSSPSEG
jgi:hypothetical protein